MPRKYDMSKRALAREETRRRIVEATAKLHGENGVLRHLMAGHREGSRRLRGHRLRALPLAGRAASRLRRARDAADPAAQPRVRRARSSVARQDLEERFERVADELFGFYERGGPHIEVDVRERQLPGMREWETYLLEMVTASRAGCPGAEAPERPAPCSSSARSSTSPPSRHFAIAESPQEQPRRPSPRVAAA